MSNKLTTSDLAHLLHEEEDFDDVEFKGGFKKARKVEHVATKDQSKKKGHFVLKEDKK